ncbi:MAG TPA: hypothetical protein VK348_11565, partial [Planctomycetota bacterium]|nr:hypothetical protein [Planctomycetota bacterium]
MQQLLDRRREQLAARLACARQQLLARLCPGLAVGNCARRAECQFQLGDVRCHLVAARQGNDLLLVVIESKQ